MAEVLKVLILICELILSVSEVLIKPLFPAVKLKFVLLSCCVCSSSSFHRAGEDEAARHRAAGGQLGAAEVHGEREPAPGHRVAEGQQAAGGGGQRRRRREEEEEMDTEPEEPGARAQWEVHLPRLQPRRTDQRHLQGGGHT